eukprot:gnl/TRDRNA2_/TRDRNA2_174472_c8_seq1.p1 gnl/TRDRNA2_/TRDRNA2_174472_c8~~gnl/TRDRNA2_/TRDRNA2_174472_c8_seq1.p1  ORF type:complete len:494 (-),score=139.29 gnl/TRDRNA2_/TRDRNA2_174472_c8_seq1:48-1529(-)
MPDMILKCAKTGKILWNQAEASKHAEEIGAANFEEVAADAKLIVDAETKRRVFWSQEEVARMKQRTRQPDYQTIEITVTEYRAILDAHAVKFQNDAKVSDYAKSKIVDALVEVKGHSVLRAEKACWFTQNKGVSEAEAWIEAHKGDADIDQPMRLPAGETKPAGEDGGAAPMEVDGEGGDAAGASSSAADGSGDAGGEKATDASATENAQFVKERISQSFVEELVSMGFPQVRAEKALYFTDSLGVENAVNWLTDHAEDEDIDHPMVRDLTVKKPKLSKEEAAAAAKELQDRLRREREAREKQEAKDKERARIESTKMMNETNALLQEEERKRAIEQRKREKEEHDKHAAELKERLRLDYIERFGKEPPSEEQQKEDDIKNKPLKQQALYWINQLKKTHGGNPDKLKVCINTLKVYLKNARENPMEPKFRAIKKGNKAFVERVAPFEPEVFELLRANGFKDDADPEVFAITGVPDGFLMGETIKFLDLIADKL